MNQRVLHFGFLVLLLCSATTHAAKPTGQPSVQFNRDVRPILADACFHCHGPDSASRKADLRLDRAENVFRKKEPLVVAGKPDDSPLYERITSDEPSLMMPPPAAHKQLKPAQKETIRRWIAEGAKWEAHWSFITPERPALPDVKHKDLVKNPIDRFVLAKLESMGLAPAPEADAATLCRRVYLDLTGLPPTPGEAEAFVSPYSKATGAEREETYLALVDKLLDSPRYGEHRARYWLDAARYADTHGLHFDNYREIWPYRDWVVQAFQKNQPFDQFTIEQIAGDLLPHPTAEQKIATGFHRCNMTTNEGGTIAEENLANYARDRVETTSWVWLGLTANCCVCHDHKFDPITAHDFYAMSAFFRNTTQGALDGNIKDTLPILYLPQRADAERYAAIPQEIEQTRQSIEHRRVAAQPEIAPWLKTVKPEDLNIDAADLSLAVPFSEGSGGQVTLQRGTGKVPLRLQLAGQSELEWRSDSRPGSAIVLPAENILADDNAGDFDTKQPFAIAFWLRPPEKRADGVIVARGRTQGHDSGWSVSVQEGTRLDISLSAEKVGVSIRATSGKTSIRLGEWAHVAAVYDGSGLASGLQFYVNGKAIEVNRSGSGLTQTIRSKDPLTIGRRANNLTPYTGAALSDLRVYGRLLMASEIAVLAQLPELKSELALAPEKRNAERLTSYYLERIDVPYRKATRKLRDLLQEKRRIETRSTVTHIQEEKMDSPAMANILLRGQYDKLGDKVTPAVFAALNPLPTNAPKNRLGLAQWLVDRQNPLTSRVIMNRYWQEVFGVGLVKTSEDFGIMGEAPSHPELLDWLAVEFRDGGWNVKHMFKLMVTSATYRQAATTTADKLAKDRDNRLLSRGPRFRMDAEMIRDYFLAASSTLSPRMGGPGTKPYQPEGIWDIVGLPGGNTRDYHQDKGENLYRRSLYTFWKRMAPPPNMETFNAPSREFSCLRRERTNTPLQALVTLNDPQFVEASRNLAQRVLRETGTDNVRRLLDTAARRILCRPLRSDEDLVLLPAVTELLTFYQAHAREARELIAVGETRPDKNLDPATLATWTNVCNTLFNMDEVLNK